MAELMQMRTVYKIYATEFKGEPTLLATVDGEEVRKCGLFSYINKVA